ncbi:D-erythronate dehydrogenase [Nesterenkonia lacusekhoensis]|uniref:Nucleoside-diphosphate-sugar epimerase n=1 Tax=Nesterenkonia lacusekhoensis TaxID=150832 RepID=A0ABS4T3G1_9MICC|nr:D-erythronate dehydrogenase [Nesterenkonia lacusekhoensis]MBP2318943.1 nucleoside-diphosphate-sugar epimerase [Nesterenkonia lacusekhoensis]
MKIIVTGGAGFLGSRVIGELLAAQDAGRLPEQITEVVSLDLAETPVRDPRVSSVVGDIADPELLRRTVDQDTWAIYHMAAVLSGGSEEDFDLSHRVNVEATHQLLEAARATGTCPRFLFTSSIAVFGGEMPEVVPENLATQPDSTYGAFKAIGELLVNDYSRKGFVDARICRLPTISVRPGRPNSAASSFASGIIREPLQGEASVCPVPLETRMWLSSPNTVVANLVHAVIIGGEQIGRWRVLNLPGLCVTVGEMLSSLTAVGGQQARDLVTHEEDERIKSIVLSWPGDFEVDRVLSLGFGRDESFTDAVRQFHAEFVASGQNPTEQN